MKTLGVFLLVALIAASLAACSKSQQSAAVGPGKSAYNGYTGVKLSAGQLEALRPRVALLNF